MLQLKLGTKGEIVIPKKVREHLGLIKQRKVLLIIKDKSIEIKPVVENIVEKWERRAKKYKADVSKWKMGDELYEEVF